MICLCCRFIQRHILEDPQLLDAQAIYSLLAEPLNISLNGRCFEALLSKPQHNQCTKFQNQPNGPEMSHGNPRWVATQFKLLGRPSLYTTVLKLLQNRLKPLSSSPAEVKMTTASESTVPSSTDSGSILSTASSIEEPSLCVSLHTCTPTPKSSEEPTSNSSPYHTCVNVTIPRTEGDVADSENDVVEADTNLCLSETTQADCDECAMCASCEGVSGVCVEVCGDILSQLMATWRGEECSPQSKSKPLQFEATQLTYEETLPDSESFLEELQCDFSQSLENLTAPPATSPAPYTGTTKPLSSQMKPLPRCVFLSQHSSGKDASLQEPSLQPSPRELQYTPDLFTYSNSGFSCSTSNGSSSSGSCCRTSISPELFSSPRHSSSSTERCISTSRKRWTPVIVGSLRAAPKRRLLHPLLQCSLHTPSLDSLHTPSPHSPLTETNGSHCCFSPELFP